MDEHRVVTDTGTPRAEVDRVQATTDDPYASRRAGAVKLTQAIWLIFGIIEALLLIRFVLRALGANPDAGFAQLIYSLTAPLVSPFVGLFGNPQSAGQALELHTLVALVVFALVGWALAKVAWLAFGETRSATVTNAQTARTRTP